VGKPKLEWAEKGEAEDFDAAAKYLSLLCPDAKAKALVKSLRNSSSFNTLQRTCCAPRTSRSRRATSRTWTTI